MNGKGEITDVSLNCAFLNDKVSKVTPFIEFESIHLSKLGFHVTSWTNLRKAPILVDIENITATIQEPLHYVDRSKRRTLKMLTEGELLELILAGLWKPTRATGGSYGLMDRIMDNMICEHLGERESGDSPTTAQTMRVNLGTGYERLNKAINRLLDAGRIRIDGSYKHPSNGKEVPTYALIREGASPTPILPD